MLISPEDRATIIDLWSKGLSAAKISSELNGRLSRNAIHGFAFRNRDLCPLRDRIAATLKSIPDRKPRVDAAPKVKKSERRGGKTSASGNRSASTKIKPPRPVLTAAFRPATKTFAPGRFACLADAMRAPLRGCRWPLEEDGQHWFCGARRIELKNRMSSYCREHQDRSVGRGTPSERRALHDVRSEAA